MPKLNYLNFNRNTKKKPDIDGVTREYSRKNSFYFPKGNGNAFKYLGNYPGEFQVFKATRRPESNLPIIDDDNER